MGTVGGASHRLPPGEIWRDTAILILAVVALRCIALGNPLIHIDEEFYLFVGKQMLNGALPFVDIWDRKPIGLFLLYAGAASVGDGILAYQWLAMLFVSATTLLVYHMARRYADRPTALLAALIYPTLLNLCEGVGGQAPVFYNLLVTAAAAILMRLATEREDRGVKGLIGQGSLVMILIGLSLQIKYSVVGEGFAFGLILVWLAWRRHGIFVAVGCALVWSGIALLPTMLVLGYYAALGRAHAFLFANFLSVALRASEPASLLLPRLVEILKVVVLPLALGLAGVAARLMGRRGLSLTPVHRFILLWNGAAFLSVAAFGTYFNHYAQALAAPLALLFACSSGIWLRFRALCIVAGAIASVIVVQGDLSHKGDPRDLRKLVAAMHGSRNCPYVYEGSPMIYHLGKFCIATNYPFPAHLNLTREVDALGIGTQAELQRIVSRNPDFIVIRTPLAPEHRKAAAALMFSVLHQRYRKVMHYAEGRGDSISLYRLRPGFTPLPNAIAYGSAAPAPHR